MDQGQWTNHAIRLLHLCCLKTILVTALVPVPRLTWPWRRIFTQLAPPRGLGWPGWARDINIISHSRHIPPPIRHPATHIGPHIAGVIVMCGLDQCQCQAVPMIIVWNSSKTLCSQSRGHWYERGGTSPCHPISRMAVECTTSLKARSAALECTNSAYNLQGTKK